jgi:hypothetical protein
VNTPSAVQSIKVWCTHTLQHVHTALIVTCTAKCSSAAPLPHMHSKAQFSCLERHMQCRARSHAQQSTVLQHSNSPNICRLHAAGVLCLLTNSRWHARAHFYINCLDLVIVTQAAENQQRYHTYQAAQGVAWWPGHCIGCVDKPILTTVPSLVASLPDVRV